MDDTKPTFRSFVSTFTDFLTVAIHTILYERCIYPRTSFLLARKYNFAVRQSRHPKVCEWINDAVSAVREELLKCSVDRVAVVLHSKDNKALERFVFDVSRFPFVQLSDVDTPIEQTNKPGEHPSSVLPLADMEEQFRATMSRFSVCGSKLDPLPAGSTFTIAVELKKADQAPVGHPQPWIPVQPSDELATSNSSHPKTTKPVRTVSAGEMVFETWIEQNDELAFKN